MMLKITMLDDIEALRENYEVECKLAAGRDGQGEIPKDVWETYSSFANTDGGDIFLGLEEKQGAFKLSGIANTSKVLDDFWNLVNNPQKVSINILKQEHVREINLNCKTIIRIHVPRALRKQRPVYIGNNPMTGTFKRQNSGDYRCDDETVRRMLAEQIEDSRDTDILFGYNMDDLDSTTFNAYRQLYVIRQPDHPWNTVEPLEFLRNIGAWRIDRESGRGGLTRAGLLMFGRLPSIQEHFPHYMLDYQERSEPNTETRWIDRIILDGTWSGNLFDFYRQVFRKLTNSLKVPFTLKGDIRQDETPIHQAIREALINTLVHADYSGRASILVVKRPDMFGFRNPGLMRVPHEIAIQGGESDCRNRLIHQMFRYVGLGEQAGSGIPKIYRGWGSQHWRKPLLYEKDVPSEQTLLELRMLDLLPAGVMEHLRKLFPQHFKQLGELERLILATAVTEQVVTHRRMVEITTEHNHDLTKAFQSLSKNNLLITTGQGRGTVYCLPGHTLPTPEQAFGDNSTELFRTMSEADGSSYGHSSRSSGSKNLDNATSNRDSTGCLVVAGLNLPVIDNLEVLDKDLLNRLVSRSSAVKDKPRADKGVMEAIILDLCSRYYLTLPVLSQLLGRKPDPLRKSYLKPLAEQGMLMLAFPQKPTDPRQAYTVSHAIQNMR